MIRLRYRSGTRPKNRISRFRNPGSFGTYGVLTVMFEKLGKQSIFRIGAE